jgi:hypothetical protein
VIFYEFFVGVEYTALSDLRRWDRNPKLHDIEALAASIRRHGFVEPVVRDERTGKLVAGHGRDETLEMMKRAGEPPPKRIKVRESDGEWLVPCLTGISFEDESIAEAYIIGSNRLVELGGWDEEALQAIITTDGFDALGTGLSLDMPDDLGTLELDTSGLDPASSAELEEEEELPKVHVVRVGKMKLPITDTEKRELIAAAESYEETTGGLVGFWTSVLKGASQG